LRSGETVAHEEMVHLSFNAHGVLFRMRRLNQNRPVGLEIFLDQFLS
jgi:hypothetical protein